VIPVATRSKDKVSLTWQELGEILSKAGTLLPDEDIAHATLTKPRSLLLHTERRSKENKE